VIIGGISVPPFRSTWHSQGVRQPAPAAEIEVDRVIGQRDRWVDPTAQAIATLATTSAGGSAMEEILIRLAVLLISGE